VPNLSPAPLDIVDLLPCAVAGWEFRIDKAVRHLAGAPGEYLRRKLWKRHEARMRERLPVRPEVGLRLDRRVDLQSPRPKIDVTPPKGENLADASARRLREFREMLAMTQTDVAETLAISQKRVSEIERGDVDRTKVDTLRRYADALGGTLRVEVKVGDETYQIA
jgi:DNA-binding XRE family transcriptional regulator